MGTRASRTGHFGITCGYALVVTNINPAEVPLLMQRITDCIDENFENVTIIQGGEIGQYRQEEYREGKKFSGQIIPHGSFNKVSIPSKQSEGEDNPGFDAYQSNEPVLTRKVEIGLVDEQEEV